MGQFLGLQHLARAEHHLACLRPIDPSEAAEKTRSPQADRLDCGGGQESKGTDLAPHSGILRFRPSSGSTAGVSWWRWLDDANGRRWKFRGHWPLSLAKHIWLQCHRSQRLSSSSSNANPRKCREPEEFLLLHLANCRLNHQLEVPCRDHELDEEEVLWQWRLR